MKTMNCPVTKFIDSKMQRFDPLWQAQNGVGGLRSRYYDKTGVAKYREWRGLHDTMVDYRAWLKNVMSMAAMVASAPIPCLKGFWEYRWMGSYLGTFMFIDRLFEGYRGPELVIAHMNMHAIVQSLTKKIALVLSHDLRIGGKDSDKIIPVDEVMPPLFLTGFKDLIPIPLQTLPEFIICDVDQQLEPYYIDVAESFGLPADVCPEPAAECGVAVVDDYPRVGKCYFTGTMPCDGAISQTNILTRHFKDLPSFQITPPQRVNEPEVQTYAVKNLKKGIEFLEQQFGVKWDWDAFWKNAEMYNDTSRCMVEKWDVNCTDHPQVCGAALALQREYEFMAAACMDKFMHKTDLRVTKMMLKGYEQDKAANAPQPKYRCLVWACPAHYYTNFTYWTQHCWGVTCVNDMEAMLSYLPITIGDKEQALADLVRCYEKMMMRSHTNGGYVNLLDECWKMCEKFRTNIVIMYDHVSCKNVGGLHGLFEDQARERGIHLIWIPHDVMDPRTVSRREMREAFSQYMVTVLNEKPLDPTLLDYEDALSW